jgi:hypothetical protein
MFADQRSIIAGQFKVFGIIHSHFEGFFPDLSAKSRVLVTHHRGSSAPITVRDFSRRSLPLGVDTQTKASAAFDFPKRFSPRMIVTENTYRCLPDVEGLTIRAVSSASIAYTRSSNEIWAAPMSVSLTQA